MFITAEGLLMYLQPDEALGLIAAVRRAVPRRPDDVRPAARLVRGMGRRGMLDLDAVPGAADAVQPVGVGGGKAGQHGAGHRAVHDIALPPGRGKVFNAVLWSVQRLPLFDSVRPVTTLLEFG